jgi:MFS family permease
MRFRDWDRNLKIRLLGESLMNLLFWMFFPFMSIYFMDSFGKKTTGFMLVLSQLAGVISNLIGGWCADRFGRRRMMLVAATCQVLAFLLFTFANSPWFHSPALTFACFAFLGVGASLYWPACQAMVADVVKPEHRNEVFAVFYTATNIAVVLGPVLGGIFFFHYRFPLLIAATLSSLFLAVLIARFIRETAPTHDRSGGAIETERKWHQFLFEQLRDYRIIFADRNFLLFLVGGILVAQTFLQLDLLVAIYVAESVPVQPLISFGDWSVRTGGSAFYSWLVAENGLLVALFTVWVTRMVCRWREKHAFILSAVLYGSSMIAFTHSPSLWTGIMAILLFTAGELMAVGVQEGFISKLAPEHLRGQYFAAASLRFTVSRTIAPLSIPLASFAGYTWTFWIFASLAFLGAGTYHVMFRRLEGKRTDKRMAA